MQLAKSHTKVYLCIFGAIATMAVFAGLAREIPSTFADETETQISSSETHFITIHDGTKKLTIKSNAVTVAEALKRANITYSDVDIIEPARTDFISEDNFHINIYRAHPAVVVDGSIKKYVMTASFDPKTIAENAGFSIYDGDEIRSSLAISFLETGNAPVYTIVRNGGETITTEVLVPYSEETREDSTLAAGETQIVQQGEEGRKILKYSVKFVDGVEVSRELVSETVVKEPVAKITAVGSRKAALNIRPEQETCAAWARAAGVSEADLETALTVIYHESGCRPGATNASSGAYGIPQALPGNKMASAGEDWETNPVTQIRWMIGYVNGRYGGWSQAWAYWQDHGWY